jgi:hypothetical protein
MRAWLEQITDDAAALEEHGVANPVIVAWARSMGDVEAVMAAPNVPPAARQAALEELAR